MAEASSESAVGKFVGAPIMAALGAWVGWATAGSTGALGSALVHLLAIAGGICGLAFGLIYTRNLGILGAVGEERDTPSLKLMRRYARASPKATWQPGFTPDG
jgi:hypothetical protein